MSIILKNIEIEGNLFLVKVQVDTLFWIDKMAGKLPDIQEIIFDIRKGKPITKDGSVCKGALEIAQFEFYKYCLRNNIEQYVE